MLLCFFAIAAGAKAIKCYLSGVRNLQIAWGFPDTHIGYNHTRLKSILRGIKYVQAESNKNPHPSLPITPDIMALIQRFLQCPQTALLCAAFTFLHAMEFTVPSLKYSPVTALDSHSTPTLLRVHIKVQNQAHSQRC